MIIRTLATASLAVMLMSSAAYAASDYLMQLGDVKSDARSKEKWIEIQSYSWGTSNPTGRVAAVQPPSGPGSVTVTTASDASCAKGTHIPQAVLKGKTGSYTLDDVTVTACNVHGDPHVQEMSYGKVSYSDLSIMSSPTPKKGAQ